MGGTSADVGIIVGGEQRHTTEYEIEWGVPAAIPLIDIKSIGAGGGSIAWVDAGGFLRVGPQSAGAAPGPICYGRGGTQVDGHRREPRSSAGSTRTTSSAAGCGSTRRAMHGARWRRSASRLGMAPLELASSIVEIANENMASAIKMVSLERGHDPRRFALFAFGGAGPLHAAAVARALGIPRVLVPLYPGNASRRSGCCSPTSASTRSGPRRSARTRSTPALVEPPVRADRRARASPSCGRRASPASPRCSCAINMRYFGQNYEHEVEIAGRRARPTRRSSAAFRALRRAPRGALRLRDRGRGDRAASASG